jgi:LacI family transcriptional regulator
MRVRIGDVAKAAGVSMKTVSRVMNNEISVKEDTRLRIQALAKEMNYRPDPSARSLAGRRSYLVGLLYDNPSANYMMEILTGVVTACQQNHYGMVLYPLQYDDPDFVKTVESLVRSSKLDGLILTPPIADNTEVLDMLDLHCVHYSCVSPRFGNGRIGVHLDEHAAVHEMMAHLVSLGHKRIAHIKGHPSHGAAEWRLSGYRSGLRVAGLPYDPELVLDGRFTFESGVEAAKVLLDLPNPPTAIFAGNDDTAAGVMRVAHERALRIPQDLSVCGFDNLPMSRQIFPAMTTVNQPTREMGEVAAVQLFNSIKDRNAGKMVKMTYELILRQSTGEARKT